MRLFVFACLCFMVGIGWSSLRRMEAGGGAVCNDGTPYQFYQREGKDPRRWLMVLEGGAWCFDQVSCGLRWNASRSLMSSVGYREKIERGGILDEKDPTFGTWNVAYFPYCTSDDFSGNATNTNTPWSFLGSRVVPAVISNLLSQGVLRDDSSTTVLLTGLSAGAEAVFPNIDFLQSNLLPNSVVIGLADSGYFLDSVPFAPRKCIDAGSCTEQEGIQRGVALWRSVMNTACVNHFGPSSAYRCLLGPYVYPFIKTPLMLFQWRFDAAQLGHDNVNPTSGTGLAYAQNSAANLTRSFAANSVKWVYSPSCYRHTILEDPKTLYTIKVGGVGLMEAIGSFLQNRNTPIQLIDQCDSSPNCNPSCP